MAPHTTSPTLSSQGLGISFSNRSPPQQEVASYGYTGMGMGPRPDGSQPIGESSGQLRVRNPLPRPPNQDLGQSSQRVPQYQQHTPYYPATEQHRQHYAQYHPMVQQPVLYTGQPVSQHQQSSPSRSPNGSQAAVVHRPTHSRGDGSKGFASFSAIPPSPLDGPPSLTLPSSSVRRLPQAPIGMGPTSTESSSRPALVARADSSASTSTSTSWGPRRSKSTDLLRRFSKSKETLSGGRYIPLTGNDLDEEQIGSVRSPQSVGNYHAMYLPEGDQASGSREAEFASAVELTPKAVTQSLPYQSSESGSRHRSLSSSTVLPATTNQPDHRPPSLAAPITPPIGPNQSEQSHTPQTDMSSESRISEPLGFPEPPSHPPTHPSRTNSASSDPTYQMSQARQLQPPMLMPRSLSQPLHFHDATSSQQNLGLPEDSTLKKRASQVSTGIHSKNAVLFSAESGGVMLAFSPSGDAVWRQGQTIDGSQLGMTPTPESLSQAQMAREDLEDELKARPWSRSTFDSHDPPQPSFLRAHGRSSSDGATVLARQGTLFYPSSSSKRASQELGVMLGGRRRRLSANAVLSPPDLGGWEQAGGSIEKVKLEASKKRKARVEVDVVLERECVVEGGQVRGRMEVRVTGGKKSEGLRIGGGKIRVIGFEELASSSRHIFYHHLHELPLFAHPPLPHPPRSSLFASAADSEGFHLAAEGSHSIPFRMDLPTNGGAKGSYTPPNGKGPCVRYVVVGSVKIHVPSTGKRSIAHFYRQIVVLPYLNPSLVLAPSPGPVQARVEKGLGWSLGGEKGRVEVQVALGRRSWVSGQRIWCEVGIANYSTRKIKSLHLALLQTVQTFNPQPKLDASDDRRASLMRRGDMGAPDADACQTSTTRKKINEEVMEADFSEKGAGRVTGKGWWTGVEPGESGHWDLSILAPSGMLSIRRTRLIEVMYALRVTVNGSIYVDIPVTLINFLSIDPPPMPSEGPRLLAPMGISAPIATGGSADPSGMINCAPGAYAHREPQKMRSNETMQSLNPAKASSTTLHLDMLLEAGRIRAEIEGRGTETARVRPSSVASEYTAEQLGGSACHSPRVRPKHQRFQSFLSTTSLGSEGELADHSSEGHDEEDKALLAARRAQGRQRSLAAISRAHHRAKEVQENEADNANVNHAGEMLSPIQGEYRPDRTPAEVSMPIVANAESFDSGSTPRTFGANSQADGSRSTLSRHVEQYEDDSGHPERGSSTSGDEIAVQVEEEDNGDETILEELVSHHSHHDDFEPRRLLGEYGGIDYADEAEDSDYDNSSFGPRNLGLPSEMSPERRASLPRHLPQIDIDPRLSMGGYAETGRENQHPGTRSFGGSLANSTMSDRDSEVGQVYEAIKRNVSIKIPSRVVNLPDSEVKTDGPVEVLTFDTRDHDFEPSPSHQVAQALLSINSAKSGRRGIAVSPPSRTSRDNSMVSTSPGSPQGSGTTPYGQKMGRESNNPPVSSPLRPQEDQSGTRVIPEKSSSLSFATPRSPLKVQRTSLHARSPHSPSTSPRTGYIGELSVSTAEEPMTRGHSGQSMLRNTFRPPSTSPPPSDDSEHEPPGLAPSIASSSASSEGLDSPPVASFSTTHQSPQGLDKGVMEYMALRHAAVSPEWTPGAHLHTQINYLETDPNPTVSVSRRPSRIASSDDHSISSHGTHETVASILPGVRSKIAQLESRDEALRKFSVANIASNPGSFSAQVQPSLPSLPPIPRSPAKHSTGRKSYTSALAPRPLRSASGDMQESQLGGITYIRPRSQRDSAMSNQESNMLYTGHLDPFGIGLQRNTSTDPASTSATAFEAALGKTRMGPRVYAGGSASSTFSARLRDQPRVPSPIVAEEEDDSEGML